jgi:integration host factor subunit beta
MNRPRFKTRPACTARLRGVFPDQAWLPPMTRSDLVTRLTERFGQLTQRDTEFAVKTILDAMSDALARGHRIEIRGFGSFSVSRRPPRIGRNPRSGAQVTIPEKRVPHFKAGKALREAVDQSQPVDPAHPPD